MSWWADTLGLALALGCDAFAVGLGVGTRWHGPRQVFRLAFHFGLFQFLMPLLGWPLGRGALGVARGWAPWLAFAVLLFLGLRMAKEALSSAPEDLHPRDPTRGLSLVGLSLATSIDALGAGFSLGLVGRGIWLPAVVIGLVAGAMTYVAMRLGGRLSRRFGRGMDLAGGLVLVGLAFKMLLV